MISWFCTSGHSCLPAVWCFPMCSCPMCYKALFLTSWTPTSHLLFSFFPSSSYKDQQPTKLHSHTSCLVICHRTRVLQLTMESIHVPNWFPSCSHPLRSWVSPFCVKTLWLVWNVQSKIVDDEKQQESMSLDHCRKKRWGGTCVYQR